MRRPGLVVVVVAAVAGLAPDARACSPLGYPSHVVIPSMQATDQTPPTLPAIPPPEIHRSDGSGQGCDNYCPSVGSIRIAALATDDMTAPDKIGYRFTLEAGALPEGFSLPAADIETAGPSVGLFWSGDTRDEAVDFTLQVIAIDLAGNESAPQTVRVAHDPGGACAVAGGAGRRAPLAGLLLAALLVAARRSRP